MGPISGLLQFIGNPVYSFVKTISKKVIYIYDRLQYITNLVFL